MTDKTIKKLSRQLNKGSYLRSFSIILFAAAELIIFSVLPFALIKVADVSGFKSYIENFSPIIFPIITGIICTVITFFAFSVFSSVSVGEKAWYSGRMSGKRNCGKRLRFWFLPSKSFKALRLEILITALKLLWTVVFLSPALLIFSAIIGTAFYGGIEPTLLISLAGGGCLLLVTGLIFRFIVVQRYFLAPYLMAQNPKLKVIQAVKQSKNLLEGHIFKIVKFKLKHLPSFLLYPLIFPAIFFYPNYKQGCSVLAKEICL